MELLSAVSPPHFSGPDSDDFEFGETVRGLGPGTLLFQRYRLKNLIGRGGMGVVWLARDERLDREIALKLLPDMLLMDAAARDDLKRETRKSLELTHTHIVRIYDFVEDEAAAAITMEYVDGQTLSHLRVAKPARVFETDELSTFLPSLCEALGYAHQQVHMVHRDLKPTNIMVTNLNVLKVADFGIACSMMNSVNRISMRTSSGGTLAYMSPQQMIGESPSASDDIYAVGATLYELLTSKPPFYSGDLSIQVREAVPESLQDRRTRLGICSKPIPQIWEQVIADCLAKDPRSRPQHAVEIAQRLGLNSTPPIEVTDTRAPINPDLLYQSLKSNRLKIAGTLVAGILLILAAQRFWSPSLHQTRPPTGAGIVSRGGLLVKTIPEGATVTVGGDALEVTPATFRGISAGTYPVKITMDGYEPVNLKAEVVANEFRDLGTLPLTHSKGTLQLTTVPAGVEFEIKGEQGAKQTGQTPRTVEGLSVGKYLVTFTLPGWPSITREIVVERNATANLQWTFGQGNLCITSEPSGASVSINGTVIGVTPFTSQLPSGHYPEINLSLDGFQPATMSATVEEDKTTTLEKVVLSTITGSISVIGKPAGLEVFLDGNLLGVAPLKTELPIGSHELTARCEGFTEKKRVITVVKGEEQAFDFTFQSARPSKVVHRKSVPPTTWQKIGTTLKNAFK